MFVRLGQILYWMVLGLSLQPTLTCRADELLPEWVSKAILERRQSQSRDVIEESTYHGKRAFLLIRGDRFDTGDEHVLYGDDGKEICQYGGLVGKVTAGACEIDKIVYVRTLYSAKSQ